MIALKEDGAARGLLMGKKLPGNGAFSGVAEARKPQAVCRGSLKHTGTFLHGFPCAGKPYAAKAVAKKASLEDERSRHHPVDIKFADRISSGPNKEPDQSFFLRWGALGSQTRSGMTGRRQLDFSADP